MSNSPTKAELRAAFALALASVQEKNQTLNQQCDAAKKETVRIQKECDILRKLVDKLKEQRHEAEEKCCIMEKNVESAKQKLQKEIKTKNDEVHRKSIQVKKLEEQLEDMKNSMTTSLKDNELSQLRGINNFQKQIIGKGEEISELELKLVKLNYKLQEAMKKLELHILKLALFAFEKALFRIRDPKFRGNEWETFFTTNDYEGLLEKEGYKGSVRKTIISLFSRMNNNAHDVYDMEQDLVLTSNNFSPDEVQFLTALWKIQPLSHGSLTFLSSEE